MRPFSEECGCSPGPCCFTSFCSANTSPPLIFFLYCHFSLFLPFSVTVCPKYESLKIRPSSLSSHKRSFEKSHWEAVYSPKPSLQKKNLRWHAHPRERWLAANHLHKLSPSLKDLVIRQGVAQSEIQKMAWRDNSKSQYTVRHHRTSAPLFA